MQNQMKRIFILFEGVSATKNVKVHGGGNFARWIAYAIKDEIEIRKLSCSIFIIFSSGYTPKTKEEQQLYNDPAFHCIMVNTINEIPFHSNDILFVPIGESCHSDLKRLKKLHPELIIKSVVHGIRNKDLIRYESYQKYYNEWYKRMPGMGILSIIRQLKNGIKEIKLIKKLCKASDEIYTDSNNSMQLINRIANPKKIKYYQPAAVIVDDEDIKTEIRYDDKFILLVNANRVEKNSIRTLVAFCKFKKEHPEDDLKFYLVGVTKHMKKMYSIIPDIPQNIYNKYVRVFDYVSSYELKRLFEQCYFFLYPSKSEGYGLPLIDAMNEGKPSVASMVTSVPEVLGAAAYYVDPYDTDSIKNGIAFMNDKKNNQFYCERVAKVKTIISIRQEFDKKLIVEDILGLGSLNE